MNTDKTANEEKGNGVLADVSCRTIEVAKLMADALLGTGTRNAMEGSAYDRQRKRIINEITKNIDGDNKWSVSVEDMFRVFKAGMKYGS